MPAMSKYQAVRDAAWSEHCYPQAAVGDYVEPSARFVRVARVYEEALAARDAEITRLTNLLNGELN